METSGVLSNGQVVHLKCESHKTYCFQTKWMYSSFTKVTKDLKTLNIKAAGYFKNSKHCYGRKVKLIYLVQQYSHPPT